MSENLDIVSVTETWLDATVGDCEAMIPGYSLHRLDRSGWRGGGVCIYYRDDLPARPHADLQSENLELAWLEIGQQKKLLFNNELTWKSHIRNKAESTAQLTGALGRARNSLTADARYRFYSSVIISKILYGSNAFVSNLSSTCLSRIIKLQKKALRAIYGFPPRTHTAQFLETHIAEASNSIHVPAAARLGVTKSAFFSNLPAQMPIS